MDSKVADRIAMLKSSLAQDPNDSFCLLALAIEYAKQEDHVETLRWVEQYLARGEDEGAAYRIKGRALEALERTEDARHAYREGITVARQHGHPGMAQEFEDTLEMID